MQDSIFSEPDQSLKLKKLLEHDSLAKPMVQS